MLDTSLHGARCVHICEIYAVKYVQKCVKKRLLNFHLCANVANFALFAGALCEGCRICIIRWAFLEFSGLTRSLLVIGADSANFA